MLLNALWAPEGVDEVVGKSLYAMRSGPVAGTFLVCVGIGAAVIFLVAVLASMRATQPSTRR